MGWEGSFFLSGFGLGVWTFLNWQVLGIQFKETMSDLFYRARRPAPYTRRIPSSLLQDAYFELGHPLGSNKEFEGAETEARSTG